MPVRRLCVEVSRSILLLQVLCVPWVQVYIYMYALSQNKIAVNVQRKENVYGSELRRCESHKEDLSNYCLRIRA